MHPIYDKAQLTTRCTTNYTTLYYGSRYKCYVKLHYCLWKTWHHASVHVSKHFSSRTYV